MTRTCSIQFHVNNVHNYLHVNFVAASPTKSATLSLDTSSAQSDASFDDLRCATAMGVPRARLAIGAAVLVSIAAVLLEIQLYAPHLPDGVHRITGAVPRVRWDHRITKDAYVTQMEAIAAERKPIMITNSPAAHWPAVTNWRHDEYLATHVPQLTDVVMQHGSVHRYWALDAAFASVLDEPDDAMPRQDMATAAMLGELRRGERRYFSRDVTAVEGFPLADIAPRDWLFVDRHEEFNSTTLWVGGNGVSTAAHYDMSHNFFIQLVGTKRFLLAPPSAHSELNLYPWLHPLGIFTSRPQQPSLSTQPPPHPAEAAALVDAVTADLGPGDVLYLPPLWFHTAVAGSRTPSIAVNIWSSSAEADLPGLDDVPPLPTALLEPASPLARRFTLLAVTFVALVEAALGIDGASAHAWVEAELWDGRYVRGLPESLHSRCHRAHGDCASHANAAAQWPPRADELEQVRVHAQAIARGFAQLPRPEGVREIQLLNIMESLGAAALEVHGADETHLCVWLELLRCFGSLQQVPAGVGVGS